MLNVIAAIDYKGEINLSWGIAAAAITYKLERCPDNLFQPQSTTLVAEISTTSYQDNVSAPGTYFYRVTANGPAGYGTASNLQSVSLVVVLPDAPVIAASASNTTGNVTVSWTDIANAETYKIFKTPQSTGIQVLAGETVQSSIIDAAQPNDTYTYVARSVNIAGESADSGSQAVVVNVLQPSAPILNQPSSPNVTGTVPLSWNAVSAAADYIVTVANASNNWATQEIIVGTNSLSVSGLGNITAQDLSLDPTYSFTVKARTANGVLSAASNQIDVSIAIPTPAIAVDEVGVQENSGQFVVHAPVLSGGQVKVKQEINALTTYSTYTQTTNDIKTTFADGAILTYSGINILANGARSVYSVPVQFTVNIESPTVNLFEFDATDKAKINVSISAPYVPTQFAVEQADNNGFTTNLTTVYSGTGANTSFSFNRTSQGLKYYRVRGLSVTGAGNHSEYSGALQKDLSLGAIQAPVINSIGTNTTGTFTISWLSNDMGTFQLEQSTEPDFSVGLATLYSGPNKQYLHTVAANDVYFYRVKLLNAYGIAGVNSAYSTTVSADVNIGAPSIPVLSSSTVSNGVFTLSWSAQNATSFTLEQVYLGVTTLTTLSGTSTQLTKSVGQYHYRVLGTNVLGSSAYSNTINIDVSSSPPPTTALTGTITTQVDQNVNFGYYAGAKILTLTWTAVDGATSYVIQESGEPTFDTFISETTIQPPTVTTEFTKTASGAYFYRVFAQNATGISKPSNVKTFLVSYDIPTQAPEWEAIAGISDTSVLELSWSTTDQKHKYRVYRDTSPTFGSQTLEYDDYPPSVRFTNLTAGTYYYRVAATFFDAQGPYSPTLKVLVKDLIDVPDLSVNLETNSIIQGTSGPITAYETIDNIIKLSWNAITGAASYKILESELLPSINPDVSKLTDLTKFKYLTTVEGTTNLTIDGSNHWLALRSYAVAAVKDGVVGRYSTPVTLLFSKHSQARAASIEFLSGYDVEITLLDIPGVTNVLVSVNGLDPATNLGSPTSNKIYYSNPSGPVSKLTVSFNGNTASVTAYNTKLDTNYFKFVNGNLAYANSKFTTTQIFQHYGFSSNADLISGVLNPTLGQEYDQVYMGPYDYLTNRHVIIKQHINADASKTYKISNTVSSMVAEEDIDAQIGNALLSGRLYDDGNYPWVEFSPAAIPLTSGTWEFSYLGGYFETVVKEYGMHVIGRLVSKTAVLGTFVNPPINPIALDEFSGDVNFGLPQYLASSPAMLLNDLKSDVRPKTVVVNVLRPDVMRFWVPFFGGLADPANGSVIIGARKLSSNVTIAIPQTLLELLALKNYSSGVFDSPPTSTITNMLNVGRNISQYVSLSFSLSATSPFTDLNTVTLTYPDNATTKHPAKVESTGYLTYEAFFNTGSGNYPAGEYTLTVTDYASSKNFYSLFDLTNAIVEDNS